MSGRSNLKGGGMREGPDPSRYLSVDTPLSHDQPSTSEGSRPTTVTPRSWRSHHMETRPPHEAVFSPEWEIVDKVESAEKQLQSGQLTYRELQEALQERDSRIQHLQEQLESYRKTATEFSALQEHSKQQSKHVMRLRSHVDAAKLGEKEHAEFKQSLMESLHSLEDQYDKLLQDYQAVNRDRGFMVESMTALKKRNEEYVSELQQCKATMEQMKQQEDSARLQWESMRDNHRALHQKNQELLTEKQKLEAEKEKLDVVFIDKMTKMSNLGNESADLQRRIIALRKEKEDLWNELQAEKIKSQVFMEDFDHEREDRAKAHAQFEATQRELELHKERLSEVEAVNERKAGELRSALEEALASRQEVQAKASQVKQFKKQVDSLKLHVVEVEKQNTNLIQEMEKVRTELVKYKSKAEKVQKKKQSTEKVLTSASSPVAPPPPGWESRVAELQSENDQLRHDNEAYCDEVQNLQKMCASLKHLVDQLHTEQAHVSPHGFSMGSKSNTAGAMAQQQPHPPPVAGYGQDQELIRKQLQQGFQQRPQHTAGADELTSRSPPLPRAMYYQEPVPRAKIPSQPQPLVSKSYEVAPHYQPNPAISPTSQPYPNWPQDSRARNVRLQQPEVLTDPHLKK